jgi:hypothetical protein
MARDPDHTAVLPDLDPELHRLPIRVPSGVSGKVKNIGASYRAPMMFSKRSLRGTQQQG